MSDEKPNRNSSSAGHPPTRPLLVAQLLFGREGWGNLVTIKL